MEKMTYYAVAEEPIITNSCDSGNTADVCVCLVDRRTAVPAVSRELVHAQRQPTQEGHGRAAEAV